MRVGWVSSGGCCVGGKWIHLRSTFLSWEGRSNCLASLVAELPEDKRSDYKAYRDGQQRCQGRGETKPGEEDHRRKGAPWRLLVTPLWEGLRALTPPAARHWTAPQPLTELQATLLTAVPAQARPDSPCPASGHRQRGTTPFPPEGWGGWLAGSRDDAPSSATSAGRGLSPARSPERRAGSGLLHRRQTLDRVSHQGGSVRNVHQVL